MTDKSNAPVSFERERLKRLGRDGEQATSGTINGSASGTILPVEKGSVSHDVKPASGTILPVVQPISKRSPFYGRERADEVQAVYRNRSLMLPTIRKAVKSRGGKDLWAMILTAIDAGFLTETDYVADQRRRLSLRILFPHEAAASYCRSIRLGTYHDIKYVRDVILPAMIAHRDTILADPSQIGPIMHRVEIDARNQTIDNVVKVRLAERRVAKPTHEYDIVIYGRVFWPNPRPDVTTYSYDQCRAACWYFHEHDQLYKLLYRDSAKSRAMQIRFSPRWFSQYADRELTIERDKIKMVLRLINAMTIALEENPTGESKRPPPPTTDGEWPD
jgi:hypothetical protein